MVPLYHPKDPGGIPLSQTTAGLTNPRPQIRIPKPLSPKREITLVQQAVTHNLTFHFQEDFCLHSFPPTFDLGHFFGLVHLASYSNFPLLCQARQAFLNSVKSGPVPRCIPGAPYYPNRVFITLFSWYFT